jgi:MFS transporter, UMF1 family
MYDWANSVYNLTITTAIFPGYFEAVSHTKYPDNIINFLGFQITTESLFSFLLSGAFLIIILTNLLLAGISDVFGIKKNFLRFFSFFGALACAMLFMFDAQHYFIGCLMFVLATVGYAGSLVYYNSYLPVIASPRLQDKVSAMGFSYGYVGSVILLIINLIVIIVKPFGIPDEAMGCKISFLMVGVWWFGFSLYAFRHLPKDKIVKQKFTYHLFVKGLVDIKETFIALKSRKTVTLYLLAFFLYSAGIQTIMYLATIFGKSELKLEQTQLIPIILIIQLIGVVGASLISKLSKHIGNIKTLAICCIGWICICVGAYFTYNFIQFCVLAVVVGFMMGGVQSLSRSTFSKLLPKHMENASSFSFYELVEKLSIVLGTFSFGVISNMAGGMRPSIIALVLFFIASITVFVFLIKLNKKLS